MLKKNLFGDTEAYLIFDDTVINKKYGHHIELARRQYSGNEHQVVHGIGIVDQINGLIEEKKTEKVSAGKVVKVMIRTYAGTLYIAYCRHEILHTIISFFSDRYYFEYIFKQGYKILN